LLRAHFFLLFLQNAGDGFVDALGGCSFVVFILGVVIEGHHFLR